MTTTPTASLELQDLDKLRKIGNLIMTQDNRITDQPMFIVQQRRRMYGLDTGYCENFIWLCSEDEYNEASVEEADALEAEYQDTGRAKDGWQRTGYIDQWEFVTACFTEQGCIDYLKLDGHNLNEPRIYAEGSYRNEEFRAVRNSLIALARRAQPEGEAPQALSQAAEKWAYEFVLQQGGPLTRSNLWQKVLDAAEARFAPAATLSPLCGAQPAESGKEEKPAAYRVTSPNTGKSRLMSRSAMKAWERSGYIVTPLFDRATPAAQQAAAPGAQLVIGVAAPQGATISIMQPHADGTTTVIYGGTHPVGDSMGRAVVAAAPSAPGAPEAPAKLPRLYRFDCYVGKTKMAAGVGVHATSMEEAEQKARKLADKDETIKFESNQPCHVTRKCGICAAYERAAQLDGGQGEAR